MTTKTKMIAAAAAGLFLSMPVSAQAAEEAKVKCEGVNACAGKGGCKSASNECKGHNGCKGKGWTEMSEKDCKAKGGKVVADAKPAKK